MEKSFDDCWEKETRDDEVVNPQRTSPRRSLAGNSTATMRRLLGRASALLTMAMILLVIFSSATRTIVDWAKPWTSSQSSGWVRAQDTYRQQHSSLLGGMTGATKPKVKLEAHIMSKCPDAQVCMRSLVLPTMQNVSDEVDFTLSFIGRNVDDQGDDSVECMHGQTECLGNIILLCAATLHPQPKIYLGFTMCMLNDYRHIPQRDLVHGCALEHGVDFDAVNNCASDGALGMDLLRNSVARTAAAKVTKSCTVRLNDEVRCIRDGGEWKDCEGGSTPEDLLRDIKALQ